MGRAVSVETRFGTARSECTSTMQLKPTFGISHTMVILMILEVGCRESNRTRIVVRTPAADARLGVVDVPSSELVTPPTPCRLNSGTVTQVIPSNEYRWAHTPPEAELFDSAVVVRRESGDARLILVRDLPGAGRPSVRVHDTLRWVSDIGRDPEAPTTVRSWSWDGSLSLVAVDAGVATIAHTVGHATRRPVIAFSSGSIPVSCDVSGGSALEALRACVGASASVGETAGVLVVRGRSQRDPTAFSEAFVRCVSPRLDPCGTTRAGDVAGFLTSWRCDDELLVYTRTSDVESNRHAEGCARRSCRGSFSPGRLGSPLNTWHLRRLRDDARGVGCESYSVDYFSLRVRVIMKRAGVAAMAMLTGSPFADPPRECVMPFMEGQSGLSVLSGDHALSLLLQTSDNVLTIDHFGIQYRNRTGRVLFEASGESARLVP